MNDIVKVEASAPSILEREPDQMVARATKIATILADIIKKQGLASPIGGKSYIRLEGWNMMGTMLGFTPYEAEVKELPDGSYEATVEIRNIRTGDTVSRASSICGVDEKRWGNADRFARRSMAVTRATGKAYRLGFSWVMGLAGYEVSPAEDMPGYEPPFDQENAIQRDRLLGYLRAKKNIAGADAVEICKRMHGKPKEALEGVIDQWLIEVSKM